LPDCKPSKDREGAGGLGDPFYRRLRRASPQARGRGKKSTCETEALGRSRGELTTKIHLRVDGKGQIITFLLTPSQTHKLSVAEKLMEQGAIRRSQGRLRLRPGCGMWVKG